MPSCWKSSVDRYLPLTLAEYAMDAAFKSVRRSASTEPMSGFGAPRRTAMPMADRARSTRVPARMRPPRISCSRSRSETMTTSMASPRSRRAAMPVGPLPIEVASVTA